MTVFTGADLRDWHAERFPADHAVTSKRIEESQLLSWEVMARALRELIEDPAWAAADAPEAFTLVLQAFMTGAQYGWNGAARLLKSGAVV